MGKTGVLKETPSTVAVFGKLAKLAELIPKDMLAIGRLKDGKGGNTTLTPSTVAKLGRFGKFGTTTLRDT